MRKAIYPGSFDPVTNGHLWVVDEALKLFDHLTVAITVNPKKASSSLFSVSERVQMFQQIIADRSNVSVKSFTGLYTAQFAESIGAKFMVRGVRNGHDFDEENLIGQINFAINPNVSTVLVSAPRTIADVSSYLVKNLVGPEGWEEVVGQFVPNFVLKEIIKKIERESHERHRRRNRKS